MIKRVTIERVVALHFKNYQLELSKPELELRCYKKRSIVTMLQNQIYSYDVQNQIQSYDFSKPDLELRCFKTISKVMILQNQIQSYDVSKPDLELRCYNCKCIVKNQIYDFTARITMLNQIFDFTTRITMLKPDF